MKIFNKVSFSKARIIISNLCDRHGTSQIKNVSLRKTRSNSWNSSFGAYWPTSKRIRFYYRNDRFKRDNPNGDCIRLETVLHEFAHHYTNEIFKGRGHGAKFYKAFNMIKEVYIKENLKEENEQSIRQP